MPWLVVMSLSVLPGTVAGHGVLRLCDIWFPFGIPQPIPRMAFYFTSLADL